METTISVTEAHRRWGDLARIRNGHTHWISVQAPEGLWVPVFNGWQVVGWSLQGGGR